MQDPMTTLGGLLNRHDDVLHRFVRENDPAARAALDAELAEIEEESDALCDAFDAEIDARVGAAQEDDEFDEGDLALGEPEGWDA